MTLGADEQLLDALDLLKRLPTACVDFVCSDPMYGACSAAKVCNTYDWGPDPCRGDPDKWWQYHRPYYLE
jgi:hypothetical protein